MGGAEFLDLPLCHLLHAFAHLVDLTADHIVELAVIPNQLDLIEDFLISGVFAGEQLLLAGGKVHGVLDDLRVIQEAHF